MKYNPQIHHRRSIRLKGYDYSRAGVYFITSCCQDGICRFGKIENREMILNDAGKMIEHQWLELTNRFPNIELGEFVVMPNHFHGVLRITVGATLVVAPDANDVVAPVMNTIDNDIEQPQEIAPTIAPPKNKTIGDIMDAFKSITTVEYIHGVKNRGWKPFEGKLWQRNYYEIIIRDEQSFQNISNYIVNNPANWNDDKFYKS